MRITIDNEDELLRKAMKASGAKTPKEAIEAALRLLIRQREFDKPRTN